MICTKCNGESPDGKVYCADCGALLDPTDERFRNVVREALRGALKDQRYLPIEIADKAVERLWFYGRIVAIPITLVLIVLGAWGINTYKDAVRTIRTVGDQAVTNLQQHASKESDKVSQTTKVVLDRLGQAESKNLPGQVSRLVEQVSKAANEVQVAEARVVHQASKAGKELQNAEALAAQYGEEVKRLRTSIGASPPAMPTFIGALGPAASPQSAGLGMTGVTSPAIWTGLTTSPVRTDVLLRGDLFSDRPIGSLTVGQNGEYVKRAQAKLRELGCYSGDISGTFDNATSEAVVRFKKAAPYVPNVFSLSYLGVPAGGTIGTAGATVSGDVDYLTWFDLMQSAFARRCT